MNPFEKLPIDKQKRIVDASISEFANRDYETASMNKVVERAGIAKGSLFNYFKTKGSLYYHIYHLAIGEVKSYLRKVRDETAELPFEDRLSKIVDSGVQFISDHPRLARIYFRLIYSADSPDRQKIVSELQKLSDDYLGEIIQDAMDRGEVDSKLNKTQTVFYLDAVLNRFLKEYHESSNGNQFDRDEWVKGITTLFIKGLR
ncbi:MAG: TetR/AcrR family transcriptional regulator [Candidatus Marinimicrobia bacterium]|jgi:AcrR family transcriptional regulator|nr:TetR/AcrR family transcriptional regulator [Candidatus Neomarinimicrobiota bacterium]|tara:strand:- start:279 stop:884 length:606 start_codon:yes stop_codon:yes gene_type:complete